MEKPELEALADSLLDAHRTGPKRADMAEPVRDDELPPALRLMKKLDPNWSIDRERFERLQRRQATHRRLQHLEGAVTLIGGGLLVAFVWAAYSGF